METVSGLGETDRKQLAAIIRGTKGAVSVGEAATILGVSRVSAARPLAGSQGHGLPATYCSVKGVVWPEVSMAWSSEGAGI